MDSFTYMDAVLIPVATALLQLVKDMGFPRRFIPLVALAVGQGAGWLYIAPGAPSEAILAGLIFGLSIVGVYSTTKQPIARMRAHISSESE